MAKFSTREFFNAVTQMASGQIQGQIQAQEELRQRQQQDYATALQQFQIGHQLEQEQRASDQDYFAKALALAPSVQAGAPRAQFLSEGLTNLYKQGHQPYQYGLEQFSRIAPGAPGAQRFPFPAYQAPSVLSVPDNTGPATSAQGGPPGPGTTSGGQPLSPDYGALLSAYQQNPNQVAPLTTADQAARAAQAAVPSPGLAGPPAGGGIAAAPAGSPPTGAPSSVDDILGQILGGQINNPQGSPGAPPPPSTGNPQVDQLIAAGANPDVVQQAMTRQQHAHSMAGVIGGGSGSNVAGIVPPPDHHPEITQAGAYYPPTGAAPTGLVAPPQGVPPSATVGAAPQVVSNEPVLRLPGFSQPIPYGAVKPEVVARYEADFQRQLAILNRSHLPDYLQVEVARVAAQRPYQVETQEQLNQLVAVTEQLGVIAAGRGGGVYATDVRAANQTNQQRAQDIRNVLSALGKTPRAADPTYVAELVRQVGQGRIDDLIPAFSTGQFGGVEARKELGHVLSEIADPNFTRLPASVKRNYFQAAIGLGKQFGETLTFPADFVLSLTPKEKRQLAQADLRIAYQGDMVSVAIAAQETREEALNARIEGLIGRPATDAKGRHVLTPNGELNAHGRLYDKAAADYRTLFTDKTYRSARNKYLTAKQSAIAAGTDEDTAIRNLTKDTDAKVRTLADLDLKKLHRMRSYEGALESLTTEAAQANAQPTQQATGQPQPARNHGVPGAFQGNRVAAIVNGQRFMIDPTAFAAKLLSSGRAKNLPDAQRQVQQMVQAAKNGR